MKKTIILLILLLVPVGFSYSAELAVTDPNKEIHADAASGPLIGKMSSGVRAYFQYSTTAYAVETGHDKGRKTYATASGDTKIYSHAKDSDGAFTATVADSGISQFSTASNGWTEL